VGKKKEAAGNGAPPYATAPSIFPLFIRIPRNGSSPAASCSRSVLTGTLSHCHLVHNLSRLTVLAEIYGWFTEGFETKDLQEAKALLEKLA